MLGHRRQWSVVAMALALAITGAFIHLPESEELAADGPLTQRGGFEVAREMQPGEVLWVGGPRLLNTSSLPASVERVSIWGERGTVNVHGFRIMDEGSGRPLSQLGSPPASSFELADYQVRPIQEDLPGKHGSVVFVGLSVDPGTRGEISGLDVHYRVDGILYDIRQENPVTLCGYQCGLDDEFLGS